MTTTVHTQQTGVLHRRRSFSIIDVDDGNDVERRPGTSLSQQAIETSLNSWLCVFGAFTFTMPSYGFMNAVGIVQSYLQSNQLKGYSASDIGWISGIYLFLSYFFNLQIGPMCDRYGPVTIGSIGVFLTVSSFILLAECNSYWQFMVCLGIAGALGGAIVATVGMSVVAKVFTHRRGTAMGVAFTGSSVGSILFSLMLQSTLPKYGWQWSMRLMGLVIAAITIPGLVSFWPSRHLVSNISPREPGQNYIFLLDFSAFSSFPFSLVSMGQFVLEFAIFAIAGLLPTIATSVGFALEDGFTLIAILGVCSCIGRIFPGLLGDKIGHFNTIIIMIALTLTFMAALFIPFITTSLPTLYVFSGLWGFSSGSFLSVSAVCLGKTCEDQNYGRFYGTSTFFVSFSVLLSIPLGGLMLDNMGTTALAALLTGIVFLGGIFYVAARSVLVGRWTSFKSKV